MKLAYEAQPRPKAVASLSGETIVKAACGTNHTGFNQFIYRYVVLVGPISYDVQDLSCLCLFDRSGGY